MTEPSAEATPYAGPAGAGSFAPALAPEAPPEPPKVDATPNASVKLGPGDLAVHTYQDNRDPVGQLRSQLVMIGHETADHVHGIVMGDLKDLATFAKGQLARYGDSPPAAS